MKVNVIYMPMGDVAEREFSVEAKASDHNGVMLEVWRRFNRVEGDPDKEDCVRLKVRSLSCGDVLQFGGKSFVLTRTGDREVGQAELEKIRQMSATDRIFKYSFESH
jgi:hypothetical protein